MALGVSPPPPTRCCNCFTCAQWATYTPSMQARLIAFGACEPTGCTPPPPPPPPPMMPMQPFFVFEPGPPPPPGGQPTPESITFCTPCPDGSTPALPDCTCAPQPAPNAPCCGDNACFCEFQNCLSACGYPHCSPFGLVDCAIAFNACKGGPPCPTPPPLHTQPKTIMLPGLCPAGEALSPQGNCFPVNCSDGDCCPPDCLNIPVGCVPPSCLELPSNPPPINNVPAFGLPGWLV